MDVLTQCKGSVQKGVLIKSESRCRNGVSDESQGPVKRYMFGEYEDKGVELHSLLSGSAMKRCRGNDSTQDIEHTEKARREDRPLRRVPWGQESYSIKENCDSFSKGTQNSLEVNEARGKGRQMSHGRKRGCDDDQQSEDSTWPTPVTESACAGVSL